MRICLHLLFLASLPAFAATYAVGQRAFVFNDAARGRSLATFVWYPIDARTKVATTTEGNSPFVLPTVAQNASIATKAPKYPVVLVSHGSGGTADKLFWLTDHLVKNGIIVIGVNHPGNMTGDNSADGMMRVWDRAKDLSVALDAVAKTADFKDHLDLTKVAAAGHSAGGTTVLLLAGARLAFDQFVSPVPNCDGTKDPYLEQLCVQLKTINVKSYLRTDVEGDYSDGRVKAVVGFDPGFAHSFRVATLKKPRAHALVFIAEKLNSPSDEIYSKDFLKSLPQGAAQVVPDSYHMTFLMACRPDYPKNDPELKELCIDNAKKTQIQRAVAQRTLEYFQQHWSH